MKIYCEVCDSAQPPRIDAMTTCELTGDSVWGDICCSVCTFVIATITVDEPGVYDFVKVKHLS